jgi:hypothetical protein
VVETPSAEVPRSCPRCKWEGDGLHPWWDGNGYCGKCSEPAPAHIPKRDPEGRHDKLDCPWCDGAGWLNPDGQPWSPVEREGHGPCWTCNGSGELCPAELYKLRVAVLQAATVLRIEGVGPATRHPLANLLCELVGPDPARTVPTDQDGKEGWRD